MKCDIWSYMTASHKKLYMIIKLKYVHVNDLDYDT